MYTPNLLPPRSFMSFRITLFLRLSDKSADALPPYPAVIAVPRPVDDERFPKDFIVMDEPPEATVLTVVPVVAHDENRLLRNEPRAVVLLGLIHQVLDLVSHRIELFIVYHGLAEGDSRFDALVRGQGRRCDRDRLIVDHQPALHDLDFVPGHADHALDEVLLLILRVF